MPKIKAQHRFLCAQCKAPSAKWTGQCGACGEWNTLIENSQMSPGKRGKEGDGVKSARLADVEVSRYSRLHTGLTELDRVVGGGLVPGAVVLLGGEPGIGKSTLAIQAMAQMANDTPTLYVSAEESLEQLALRYQRLELQGDNLEAISTSELSSVIEAIGSSKASLVVIDSIQTMRASDIDSAPGSVSQVRECAEVLIQLAKSRSITIILIGHVTKEGGLAGPKTLEHLVDTVLYFEGDATSRYRLVRAWKNRFGTVNEVGVFAMTEGGLKEVKNPSAMFLSGGSEECVGRAVLISQDGSRPLLVEVQALVDQSTLGNPRRLSVGYDSTRLAMILAILHRHAGIDILDQDVFVNVAGGIRVAETAADLAVAAAVISSFVDKPIPADTALFGELGLSGEVRPVVRGEDRVREAQKLGFINIILSAGNQIQNINPVTPRNTPALNLKEVKTALDLRAVLYEIV